MTIGRPKGTKNKFSRATPERKSKRCTVCKREKLPSEFYPNQSTQDKLSSVCIECNSETCFKVRQRKFIRVNGVETYKIRMREIRRQLRLMAEVRKEFE
jgi:hypothetical protein